MHNLGKMEIIIKVEKDEKGIFWLDIPDEMSDYEAMGILYMMIKRLELNIYKEEKDKSNT